MKKKKLAKPIEQPLVVEPQPEAINPRRSGFARFVIGYRMMNDLSQVTLADKIKMTKTAVALAETDKFDFPIAFFRAMLPVLSDSEKESLFKLFKEAVVKELTKKA